MYVSCNIISCIKNTRYTIHEGFVYQPANSKPNSNEIRCYLCNDELLAINPKNFPREKFGRSDNLIKYFLPNPAKRLSIQAINSQHTTFSTVSKCLSEIWVKQILRTILSSSQHTDNFYKKCEIFQIPAGIETSPVRSHTRSKTLNVFVSQIHMLIMAATKPGTRSIWILSAIKFFAKRAGRV